MFLTLLAAGLAARSRPATFGAGFFAVALLPLMFSPPRGGYALYIPYMGCALYAGGMLEVALKRIQLPEWRREFIAAAALLIAGLHVAGRIAGPVRFGAGGESLTKTLVEDVGRVCRHASRGRPDSAGQRCIRTR